MNINEHAVAKVATGLIHVAGNDVCWFTIGAWTLFNNALAVLKTYLGMLIKIQAVRAGPLRQGTFMIHEA